MNVINQNRLETNRQFLAQRFPQLFARLQDGGGNQSKLRIQIVEGRRGQKTALVQGQNGSKPLHSQYDPVNEAVRWAQSLEVPQKAVVLFLGWGLGYPVLEWVERYGNNASAVIVWEPEPEWFRQSLQVIDLRRLANAHAIELVLGRNPGGLYQALHGCLSHLLSGNLSIQPLPFVDVYPREVIEQLKHETQQIMGQREAALRHMAETGYQTQRHIIGNLPHAPHCWLPRDLHGIGRSQPAIIAAAGPSLNQNIGQLTQAEGHAWLFAVDTNFSLLRRRGLDPHFVVSKDYTDLNKKHFEAVDGVQSTVLAFDPQIPPETTAKFIGPKVWLPNRNRQLHHFLKGFELTKDDQLPHSTNVALAAFNLAKVMGCDPIIFVGLDLCFSNQNGLSHAEGSALVSQTRFDHQTGRMQYSRGPASDTVQALMVEGLDGRLYPTVPNFYEALRLLERLIQEAGGRVIDASEGGAKVQGTEAIPLREAIARFCQSPVEARLPIQHLPRSRTVLHQSLEDITEFLYECHDSAFDMLNRFKDIDCPDCINFARFENARRAIESDQKLYRLLEPALERLLVEIDRPGYFDDTLPPVDLMQHYADYFSKIEEACAAFKRAYAQAALTLKEAL